MKKISMQRRGPGENLGLPKPRPGGTGTRRAPAEFTGSTGGSLPAKVTSRSGSMPVGLVPPGMGKLLSSKTF